MKSRLGALPVLARRGQTVTLKTRVKNLSTRRFAAQASYGRRLVRLGAQLCAADGTLIDRDFARAWLPRHLEGGDMADVPIEIAAPPRPGRYRLKFDLVCEGIDGFEATGSPVFDDTLGYVENDPINHVDPSGHKKSKKIKWPMGMDPDDELSSS